MPSLSTKVFLRSPGFMLSSFYWRNLGRTKPAAPRARKFNLLGDRKGSGIALLLTLKAGDTTLTNEEAKSSAHLLSRATKLASHLLVGNRSVLLSKSGEDILTEVNDLLIYLGLTRTSLRTLNLVDLLLAESDNLGVVSHSDGDTGVEVLLSSLSLGHDSSPFLGLASLSFLRVPLTRSFLRRSSSFFYIYYTIF